MSEGSGRARLRRRLLGFAPGARREPPARLPQETPRLAEGARLLVLRPDHLGDLLFVGPALDLLRARRPDLVTSLLVGPWSESVARGLPGAAEVETLSFPWFDRKPKGALWQPYLRLLRAARARAGRFDAALILRDDDWWSAWLCALARIPIRICHEHAALRPFATHVLPAADKPAHSAAANLSLVSACLGGPVGPFEPSDWPLGFQVSERARQRAEALLAEAPLAHSRSDAGSAGGSRPPGFIAVHPGSGAEIKRWRPGAWVEALDAIATPQDIVLLTGGPGEKDLTAALAALLDRPIIDLAGKTDLGELAAIYARCRLVLGPDSGPLHLAVAMGRPSLHLFGPADAARFGPWGDPARHRVVGSELPCAPCGRLDWPRASEHPCVRSIGVGRLIAAARGLEREEPVVEDPGSGLGGHLGRTL